VTTPVVAIVGRPNVGKSTLWNRLVGRRQALVRDVPGVTRDRLYGVVAFERWQATVIDTGGFDPSSDEPLIDAVRRQILTAIEEADLILFVVDARTGATALDTEIARVLRRSGRPVMLVANKVETPALEPALADLYRLGFGEPHPVSAEHGRGVAEMLEAVRDRLMRESPAVPTAPRSEEPGAERGEPAPRVGKQAASRLEGAAKESEQEGGRGGRFSRSSAPVTAIAIIGRPNVGKSSLVNALVGSERVLVHDRPGTTRDAVDTRFTYQGRPYLLIDTAGIRRKGRVAEPLEKLAVVMALRSLERCQVATILLDATEGLTTQDAHIAGYANKAGRATVIAVNKWDLVPAGLVRRAEVVEQIRTRLPFLDYAPVCFTSALTGAGLPELFELVDQVAREARRRVPDGVLRQALLDALERRPYAIAGVPLTIQSATQVSTEPPTVVVRVNRPREVHFSYERYLVNSLRRAFGFTGSPIRLLFRRAIGSASRPGPR
jgi:GTPase